MADILTLIGSIFLITLFGVLLRLFKIADDQWVDVLNKYGLYIGFPVLIFTNLVTLDPAQLHQMASIFTLNAGLIILIIVITTLIVSLGSWMRPEIGNTYIICVFLGNVAYLGYPLVSSYILNSAGELSIIISIYSLLAFSIGIIALEFRAGEFESIKKTAGRILTNPFIIAILLGSACMLASLKIPQVLMMALNTIKLSASPVVLISLGIFMVRRYTVKKHIPHVAALSLLRLAIVPAIFYLVGTVSGFGPQFKVSILEAALPVAVTPFMIATLYPMNRELIAAVVVVTTVISIFTLPVWMYIVSLL